MLLNHLQSLILHEILSSSKEGIIITQKGRKFWHLNRTRIIFTNSILSNETVLTFEPSKNYIGKQYSFKSGCRTVFRRTGRTLLNMANQSYAIGNTFCWLWCSQWNKSILLSFYNSIHSISKSILPSETIQESLATMITITKIIIRGISKNIRTLINFNVASWKFYNCNTDYFILPFRENEHR